MPRNRCCHGDNVRPCSCEMGNLYRFVEPLVLVSLARLGNAHGYTIAQETGKLAITHAGIDVAAVYRTLRRLEQAGYATSGWVTENTGPARREYTLTEAGRLHLQQWTQVLEDVREAMSRMIQECHAVLGE